MDCMKCLYRLYFEKKMNVKVTTCQEQQASARYPSAAAADKALLDCCTAKAKTMADMTKDGRSRRQEFIDDCTGKIKINTAIKPNTNAFPERQSIFIQNLILEGVIAGYITSRYLKLGVNATLLSLAGGFIAGAIAKNLIMYGKITKPDAWFGI